MDPDAPWNVAQGTVITSLTTALLSSVYGTAKKQNIGPLALSSALNSGIAAATFFSLREYIISPILLSTLSSPQYARRRLALEDVKGKLPMRGHVPSWLEMRTHKLLDSALSGAATGSVLTAWKRGRTGIIPGATTASLVCILLQLGYNEIGITRIKYVSRKFEEAQHHASPVQLPKATPEETVVLPKEESRPLGERFFEFFGMPKITDADYLARLKVKREGYLRRIAVLEAEREREREKQSSDSTNQAS